MNDIIPYMPVLGYFAFASLMFMFQKFIFSLHASILVIAMVANIYLNIIYSGSILITVLQVFFAILSFVLMVPFFAGKASGETMLAFTALIGLAPFPRFFLFSLIGFGLSIALFVIFAAFIHRDKIGDVTSMMNDLQNKDENKESSSKENEEDSAKNKEMSTEKDKKEDNSVLQNPGNVKDMLTVGVLSTYNGQFKLPDYSYLPDKSALEQEKRFSFSIFALVGYGLVVAFNFINGLFFLDS